MICSIFLCHFVFLWSNHSYIYLYFHTIMSASPSLKSSRSQMVFIIGVLKNFAIFTGTHLCWMQFLRAFRPATLLKRDSNSFFIEYLWWLLLFIETFFSVSFLFSFFFCEKIFVCMYQALAACAITRANQEKGGLDGWWKADPCVKLRGLLSPAQNSK